MQIDLLNSVETFIEKLNEKEIAKVIRTIELLEEFGNKLGMPHSRHMDDGLLELRIRGKREIRIFYCFHKNKAVLLHSCIKKTQRTLEKELTRARETKENLQ
ncbi:type II toxin-antitoxin system RelE/ParE family toxin [Candidatus Nomurabacteria bacterium]|nr:type II toxin-antitoxin system RelE/ParE family toxin [Candidatus Kaiserbacteria bacterium]MCB9814720.1 type II toxin-antitoxin system RelE/ParE family toxin [Candidatus Nomurabacteria bacterium]